MPRESSPILAVRGVSKTFGLTRVLDRADLTVMAGEIRGLVGQNGSGKSTLIKILSGFHAPDPGGDVRVRGNELRLPANGRQLRALGVGFVHQDLGLEPMLSIVDNMVLDGSNHPFNRIPWRQRKSQVAESLASFGVVCDVDAPLASLTATERAVVAIARALSQLSSTDAAMLILDEPTASLERGSAAVLHRAIRELSARGCGVLLVSHDLGEIRDICHTATVLRDGRVVADGAIGDFEESDLVRAIVGRDIGELYPETSRPRTAPIALSVSHLSGASVRDLSFSLHEGEVLGITGLPGMGQDDIPALLYGVLPLRGGEVSLFGTRYTARPRNALAAGLVLLPADRKGLGGDLGASLLENLTLPVMGRYFRAGRLRRHQEEADVQRVLEDFDVKPPDPKKLLGQLSGGNQQKALIAKWLELFGSARVLLLHEPTQGVDVGARAEIFRLIRAAAKRNVATLYISNEHDELVHLADRILVMRDGKLCRETAASSCTAEQLSALTLMSDRTTGGKREVLA